MSDPDLSSRLDRIEELAALEKLIHIYHWNADHLDWKAWSECFTENATFNSRHLWPDDGAPRDPRHLQRQHGRGDDAMQHVMVNLGAELTGPETATGHGNLVFTAVPDRERPDRCYRSGGRYTWSFAKTAEGWRIADTTLEFIWNNGEDTDDVFAGSD